MHQITASGREALDLATRLLQRVRLADPHAGIWEAADVQWWSRKPRASDSVAQPFWVDDRGPVAAVLLTTWAEDRWQLDPIAVPDAGAPEAAVLWERVMEEIDDLARGGTEVLLRDDDHVLVELARASGLVAGERSGEGWLDPSARPAVLAPADGYRIVDRVGRAADPHPMRVRNGDAVGERLAACSLYDPALDLAVETTAGELAAYSLYWFDPVTRVGMVEPVRVEDDHQRRGLARAMLTEGIDRLAARGATRIKIGWSSDVAGALYQGMGFVSTTTLTTWESVAPAGGPRP